MILRPDTSAEARNRRPAGDLARRIPPLEAGHPHTSIARTATHDRAHSNAGGTKRGKDDAASGNSPAGGKKPASRSGARKPPSAPPPPRDRRTLQQMMSDAALASDGGGAGACHTDGLEGVASPLSPPLFTPLGVQQQLSDPTRLRSLEEAVDRLTAEVRRVGEPNLVATHPKWRLS